MPVLLLLLAILFNAALAFIFKLFQRWQVELYPAVVINYFICVLTGWAITGNFPIPHDMQAFNWFPYAILLGIIFIVGFNIVGVTVQQFGVTLATIMQKMSLILTVPVAILFYSESVNALKIIGVLLALMAIVLSNYKTEKPGFQPFARGFFYLFPFFTLLVSAAIEIILQYMEMRVTTVSADPEFISSSFLIAGALGAVGWVYFLYRGKMKFKWNQVWAGIFLGVPNFCSIYFIMRSLGAGWEGSVFYPINNVGIILVSVGLAIVLLGERVNQLKVAGLILSVVSIILISLGM